MSTHMLKFFCLWSKRLQIRLSSRFFLTRTNKERIEWREHKPFSLLLEQLNGTLEYPLRSFVGLSREWKGERPSNLGAALGISLIFWGLEFFVENELQTVVTFSLC